MELTFEVPGRPQGKGRPRAYTRNGHARMYTPGQTVTYENRIMLCYQHAFPGVRLAAPVEVGVDMYFAVPKSYPKTRAAMCRANEMLPACKPDGDNVLKAVCDALNGVAYADDREVTDTYTHKRYGTPERLVVHLCGEEAAQ